MKSKILAPEVKGVSLVFGFDKLLLVLYIPAQRGGIMKFRDLAKGAKFILAPGEDYHFATHDSPEAAVFVKWQTVRTWSSEPPHPHGELDLVKAVDLNDGQPHSEIRDDQEVIPLKL